MRHYERHENKQAVSKLKNSIDTDNLEITPLPERSWRIPRFIKKQVDKVKKFRSRVMNDKTKPDTIVKNKVTI